MKCAPSSSNSAPPNLKQKINTHAIDQQSHINKAYQFCVFCLSYKMCCRNTIEKVSNLIIYVYFYLWGAYHIIVANFHLNQWQDIEKETCLVHEFQSKLMFLLACLIKIKVYSLVYRKWITIKSKTSKMSLIYVLWDKNRNY